MRSAPPQPQFSNGELFFGIVIYEILILAIMFWIGRIRGWSFATFGLRVSWKLTGAGFLLFALTFVALVIVAVIANTIHPAGTSPQLTGGVTWFFVLPVLIINPFFEELLETGYFVHCLQRYGMWPAVLTSALFRGALHAYLGFNGALSLFGMGIIFGLVYWRWRQLWPLIIAHSLGDLIFLLPVIRAA
jgi:membrane protease YdiL (CAAX protease family)